MERILKKAEDENVPVLERVRNLKLVSSRLDEYYMIRVAGFMFQIKYGGTFSALDGSTPAQLLLTIRQRVNSIEQRQMQCFESSIVPQLEKNKVFIRNVDLLPKKTKKRLLKYFYENLYAVLTPLAFDVSRPFTHIANLSTNFAVFISLFFIIYFIKSSPK